MPELACWELVRLLALIQGAQTAMLSLGLCIAVLYVGEMRRERRE